MGKNCDTPLDLCVNRPCQHGVCTTVNETYHCTCRHGYTGKDCGTVINYCDGVNCNHGKCANVNDTYICACKQGWTGINCHNVLHADMVDWRTNLKVCHNFYPYIRSGIDKDNTQTFQCRYHGHKGLDYKIVACGRSVDLYSLYHTGHLISAIVHVVGRGDFARRTSTTALVIRVFLMENALIS
jgi:peroxiredoxin family protein